MAKETASIYLQLRSGDVTKNVDNIAKAFSQARREARLAEKGSKEYIDATRRVRELKGELDSHNKLLGRTGGAWSNVKNIMLGVFGGGLLLTGMRAVGTALRDAYATITNFQKANSDLQAVLGKTAKETQVLRDQQIQLGSSTAFTASQAADAQTELAKLGFTIAEISNLTPAVLSLAAASGTDLPNAAIIAGATLRQFGLDSSETQRVVDVMAKSFSSSALDIDKFKFAMTQAAPSAAAAGLTIERTTALIGTLVDRGMRAESAGTGLRAIFGKLAKSGMSWNEAMEMINSSTNKTRTAIDLFGLEASNQALILAQNADAAGELEEKLLGAAGSAEKMAEVKLDNVIGDVTKLSSAWEGFILNIENGEGVFGKAVRSMVQGVTKLVTALTSTNTVSAQLQETLGLSYWKDGLLSPNMYKNLGELQENLNEITVTTTAYANAKDWEKVEEQIEGVRKMANGLNLSTEEGMNSLKLMMAEIQRLKKIRADAALGQTTDGISKLRNTDAPIVPVIDGETPTADGAIKVKAQTPEEIRAERAKLALAVLKQSYDEEKLYVAQQRVEGLISEEEYQNQLTALKLANLLFEREMLIELGEDITGVEQKIADARIDSINQLDKARVESADASEKLAEAELERNAQLAASELARSEAARVSAMMTGIAATDGADSVEDGAKRALNAIRGIIKGYLAEALAAVIAKSMKTVPPPFSLILAAASGAAASILFDKLVPAFAKGTNSAPGGMALVGEEGPELVNIPRGSQVFTAAESRSMMAADNIFGSRFAGNTTPPPTAGASSNTSDQGMDMAALFDRIDRWQQSLEVNFSTRDKQIFDDRLGKTEKFVKFKRG